MSDLDCPTRAFRTQGSAVGRRSTCSDGRRCRDRQKAYPRYARKAAGGRVSRAFVRRPQGWPPQGPLQCLAPDVLTFAALWLLRRPRWLPSRSSKPPRHLRAVRGSLPCTAPLGGSLAARPSTIQPARSLERRRFGRPTSLKPA